MSTILVIEPRKILQHATALALFPDHDARMMTTVPETEALIDCAAVIVDAAVLRETGGLPAPAMRALEKWDTPMVWIDGDSPAPPNRDKLIVVKRPVSRTAMREALVQCLAKGAGKAPTGTAENERDVIELVDVVEPAPASRLIKGARKKK
jgi:hypothetical protein